MAGVLKRTREAERADSVANRQRLLEAAREVFARRGLDAEVREIAQRAGVGIGTLYRHFESKEGILAAVVHRAEEDMVRRIRTGVAIEEPRAALRAMIGTAAEFCEEFGALTRVLLTIKLTDELDALHPGGHDEFHVNHPDFDDEFHGLLLNLLQRGMRDGIFRPNLDASVAIAALESIFTSGMLLALAAQRSCPAAADAVADFFLDAIAARP